MRLMINGEEREFEAPLTVGKLLERIGFESNRVAVELNLEIVPKLNYGSAILAEGDKLEIVHFIGGGLPAGTE